MNARYYDPAIGQFASPDTVVPDPTVVMDYNRYAYARGNPLKYNDPSGHCSQTIGDEDFECFYYAQQIYQTFPGLFDLTELEKMNIARLEQVFAEAWEQSHVALPPQPLLEQGATAVARTLLPKSGASSKGIAGSTGVILDIPYNFIVLAADENGNLGIGALGLGAGGTTGGNLDLGLYSNTMPGASSIDVYVGDTVNIGISAGEGIGIGSEVNVTKDSSTGKATAGLSVSLSVTAKANLPLPPVEFYGNWTRTSDFWMRSNMYNWINSWFD